MNGRAHHRRAVRASRAHTAPEPRTLLALALLGRGYEARFVHTDAASYLLTNAPAALVAGLATRVGAVLGDATRVGFSRGYAT